MESRDANFGERLKFLRDDCYGWTQQDFANKIGIPKSTLAGYETNQRQPKFETLKKIAQILNTSTDYLVEVTLDPTPNEPSHDLEILLKMDGLEYRGHKLTAAEIELVENMLDTIANFKEKS